jgi:ubiquinone/menaquinone biosynthesis C-methylase UbiE
MAQANLDAILGCLRATGEPSRLRIVALVADGELNVTDLTEILGQSQPRISRHLRVLTDAGVLERRREGSWAFFQLAEQGAVAGLARAIVASLDPAALALDRERLAKVRAGRAEAAAAYFRAHAEEWDRIRALHVEEAAVERAMLEVLGPAPVGALLDVGAGTGRTIELIGPRAEKVFGVDRSPDMLAVARANLARAGLARVQLRQGDIDDLPVPQNSFDLVLVHQVLHFLDEPARAIRAAARALRPGGRLLIVDFAPHELEFLRDTQAHRRLGFAGEQVEGWIEQAGLQPVLQRDLPPPDGAADKLTVSIWLARDPRIAADPPPAAPDRAFA